MIAPLFLTVLLGFTACASQQLSNNLIFQDSQIKFATQFMMVPQNGSAGTIFSPIIADAGLTTLYMGMSVNSTCSKKVSNLIGYNNGSNDKSRLEFIKSYTTINNSIITSLINNDFYHGKNFPIKDTYLQDIQDKLSYKNYSIDFKNSKKATKEINNKISNSTKKLINKLFPQGVIKSYTQVIITNVLYLKADWAEGFDESKTKKVPFTPRGGKAVKITMMKGDTKAGLTYDKKLGARIITKKFSHPNLRMAFIQPDDETIPMSEFVPRLSTSSDSLIKALNKKVASDITLTMPRIKIKQSLNMIDVLGATNLTCIKSEPLINIIQRWNLYASDMIHKVIFKATEKGFEGPAAIGNGLNSTVVTLDRPFIFLVYDTKKGGIPLFGTYNNPVNFPLK